MTDDDQDGAAARAHIIALLDGLTGGYFSAQMTVNGTQP